MNQKGFSPLILLLILAIVVLAISFIETSQKTANTPLPEEPIACTMDAKLCPDGSSVGRVAPKCEFAPCPSISPVISTANWKTFTSKKYKYSFKYPTDWYSFFYNESKSVAGTNTIYNYNTTEIEKYSNHGMIDYSKLGKSIEKIEITVLDGVNEDISNLVVAKDSLQIGSYPTQTFEQKGPTEMYFRELKTTLPSEKELIVVITTHNKSGGTTENDLEAVTKAILSSFQFTQ